MAFVVPVSACDALPAEVIGTRQSTDFQQGERVVVRYSPRVAMLCVRILPPYEVPASLGAGRWVSVGQCRPIFSSQVPIDEAQKLLDRAMRGVCLDPPPGVPRPSTTRLRLLTSSLT